MHYIIDNREKIIDKLNENISIIISEKDSYKYIFDQSPQVLIFQDKFTSTKGWIFNYWTSREQSKTNKIEDKLMIFEATEIEWQNNERKGQNGAYFDLNKGIFENYTYEVNCIVKSDINTTMGFQLWLHDTKDFNNFVVKPDTIKTPSINFEVIKLIFKATSTKAIRIHLHCKGGVGRIYVSEVKVYKINTLDENLPSPDKSQIIPINKESENLLLTNNLNENDKNNDFQIHINNLSKINNWESKYLKISDSINNNIELPNDRDSTILDYLMRMDLVYIPRNFVIHEWTSTGKAFDIYLFKKYLFDFNLKKTQNNNNESNKLNN